VQGRLGKTNEMNKKAEHLSFSFHRLFLRQGKVIGAKDGLKTSESEFMVASYFISVSLTISRSRVSANGSGSESGEPNRDFLLLF